MKENTVLKNKGLGIEQRSDKIGYQQRHSDKS